MKSALAIFNLGGVMELKKEELKIVSRKLAYKGGIIDYYRDTVEFPTGNREVWDIVEHRGAAATIALTKENKVVCVKQYRHAIKKNTIEIPAGGLDKNETPLHCSKREFEEETGYKCLSIEPLIDIFTTVGFCNEKIYISKALVEKGNEQHLDENEYITVCEYDIEELYEMILKGEIEDSKTICAVMTVRNQMLDKKDL